MLDFLEAQELYLKGKDYLNLKDYFNAINCFKKAALNEKFQKSAYQKLVEIYIKINNYAKARELLSQIEEKHDYCKFLQANMDFFEFNFQSSINNYVSCFSDIEHQSNNLIHISQSYFNLGEVDIAIKMLETSALNKNTEIESTLNLINYFIFMQNYNYAYKLFQKLDLNAIDQKNRKSINILGNYLKYQLDLISKVDDIYFLRRLICDDDDELIKHLQEHVEKSGNESIAYFFKYTDLKALIDDAKQKIANLNSLILFNAFVTRRYNFPTESIIGYNNEELAKDLCVIATPNNHIITMYPIYLSSAYNAEGYVTSRELALKRCQRGIK